MHDEWTALVSLARGIQCLRCALYHGLQECVEQMKSFLIMENSGAKKEGDLVLRY
jgi:hypothetical protein